MIDVRPDVTQSWDAAIRRADDRQHRQTRGLEADHSRLTARERQIAEAITHGLSNRAIAERFGVSERTIKNQLTVIYNKLDVASRLELATLLMGRRRP
jgi:DNA-binding NarL/FixJ family response regulator